MTRNLQLDQRSFRAGIGAMGCHVLTTALNFCYVIALARLLSPNDYGLWGMLALFWAVCNVFIDGGLGTALLQKRDLEPDDLSSVFYFNLFIALLCSFAMVFVAGPIARFYNQPMLELMIIAAVWTLPIGALGSTQNVILSRELKQEKIAFGTLLATLTSVLSALAAAFCGWGVWSFIVASYALISVRTLYAFWVVRWRPTSAPKFRALKSLFRFGSKILANNLLETIQANAYTVAIGKLFLPSDVAYFDQGRQYAQFWPVFIRDPVSNLLFSAFSKIQYDRKRLAAAYRDTLGCFVLVSLFPSLLLAVLSRPIVEIFLTDKWLAVIPIWQILTVSYSFTPYHVLNAHIMNACGRSDLFLSVSGVKVVLSGLNIAIASQFGIHSMAWGICVVGGILLIQSTICARNLIDNMVSIQVKALFSYLPFSVLACVLAHILFCTLPFGSLWRLLFSAAGGTVCYMILNWGFQSKAFVRLTSMTLDLFPRCNKIRPWLIFRKK